MGVSAKSLEDLSGHGRRCLPQGRRCDRREPACLQADRSGHGGTGRPRRDRPHAEAGSVREGVTMMDFRNVEWKLNRPDLIAVASDWGRTTIATVKSLDAGLTAAVDALRKTHVNGGAQVAQFSVDAGPAVRWALSRNGWNEFDLFGRFFRHQAVVEALPAVAAIKPSISAFQMEGTFTAYGRLADWIMSGGAYERFAGSDEEALDLAKGFARAAFDFRRRSPG